jgi:hypothetical protein
MVSWQNHVGSEVVCFVAGLVRLLPEGEIKFKLLDFTDFGTRTLVRVDYKSAQLFWNEEFKRGLTTCDVLGHASADGQRSN